jgi:6-phosphogluconolactonase
MRTLFNLRRPPAWFVLLLGLLVTFVAPLGASADATKKAVYTATNNPNGNAVIVFWQNSDGTLTQGPTVPTGGAGAAAEAPFSFPVVDTQGSINLAYGGHVLTVVNAGDNTISSFRVTPSGLELADRVSSGGVLPVSLTSHGNVLYTVNEVSANIYGFHLSPSGSLSPIGGQPLSTPFPTTVTAQIGFSPDGREIVVTERGLPTHSGVIDTFAVSGDGVAGPAQKHTGDGFVEPNPFGFDFDNSGHLLVSNAGYIDWPSNGAGPPLPIIFDPTMFLGSATSYNLSNSGSLTFNNDVLSGGRAACWLVVSKDGKYAYVTNTLSDTPQDLFSGIGGITRYAVGTDGSLSYLGQTDVVTGDVSSPADEAFSQDGKYLYVNSPTILGPNDSHVVSYRVGKDGSLTLVGSVGGLPATTSGLAAG